MKNLIKSETWAVCIALAVTFFGCAKNRDNSGDSGDTNQYVTVKMPIELSNAATRVADVGLDAEVAIKSAYIIVYTKDAVGSATPKFVNEVENAKITVGEGAGVKKILAFKPADNITVGDDVHVIFNREIADFINTAGSITKDGLIAAIKLKSANGLAVLSSGLPMYGSGKWTTAGSPMIKINRAVAKVQLKLDYKKGEHVPGSDGVSYKVENTTYKLYQLSDVGNINGADVGATLTNPIAEIIDATEINQPTSQYLTTANDNYTGANYIFAYPYSVKSIGVTPTPLDNKTSSTKRIAMIMKNETGAGATYHRLDLYDQNTKTYLDIINNYHYTVKVREVSEKGYTSATEALNNPASNVQFDIVVEDEGTTVVSNGQYVLNVNQPSSEFTASSPVVSVVEIAKINRVTSINAPITGLTDIDIKLQDVTTTSGTALVELAGVPAKLGKDIKGVDIAVKGEGVVTFRYTITMGNIFYTSGVITVKHTITSVAADGFCPSAGRPNQTVLNGYDVHELFGISKSNYTIKSVESSFNQYWNGVLSVAKSISTTPTLSGWNIDKGMTLGVTGNVAYFHPFRTAPGDPNIEGVLKVSGMTAWGASFSLELPLTITTSCKLPTKVDNYSIQINGFKVADRSPGAKMPSDGYEVANKYMTNQIGHPNYMAGSRGGEWNNWGPQDPSIAAIAGQYYAHTPAYDMADAHVACANLNLGSGTWRLPSGTSSGGEIIDMLNQVRHSKYRVLLLSTEAYTAPDQPSLKYSGVLICLSGYSSMPTRVSSDVWSSSHSGGSAYNFYVDTYSSRMEHDTVQYGGPTRCVQSNS